MAGGASEKEGVEQIDIGGPAMLRAAAKNFRSVIVVPSPEFYNEVLAELDLGEVSQETRRRGPRRLPPHRRPTPRSPNGSNKRNSSPTC